MKQEVLRREQKWKRLQQKGRPLTKHEVGDYVLVAHPDRPPTKLSPKWRGPMLVVGTDERGGYEVQDLGNLKVRTAHVDRLTPYRLRPGEDVAVVAALDDDEWVVEAVVGHSVLDSNTKNWKFKVRWSGYDEDADTWETFEDAKGLEQLDVYLRSQPELTRKYRRLRP